MTIGTGIGARLSSRAIIGRFYDTLTNAQPPGWVPRVAMPMQSDQAVENYRWLGMSPVMREWVGGRQAKGFLANGIDVANKVYEATLEIDLDDVRRDKTGQIMVRVDELAVRAQQHRARLLTDLIVAGESTVCYDGQFFFDTDHAEGASGTQDNDLVYDISDNTPSGADGGTATLPSPFTMQRAILRAVQQMLAFKDDQGEPMNEDAAAFDVMVPPGYMGATIHALSLPLIGGGDSNVLSNLSGFSLTPVVNPRLSWTSKFAIFRTDGRVKPFIEQTEQEPRIQAIAEGSELEIRERKHLYTVDRIGNVAYGYWQHACLTTLQA
jgi:phage major head subunit gpT-like protein